MGFCGPAEVPTPELYTERFPGQPHFPLCRGAGARPASASRSAPRCTSVDVGEAARHVHEPSSAHEAKEDALLAERAVYRAIVARVVRERPVIAHEEHLPLADRARRGGLDTADLARAPAHVHDPAERF